MYTIVDNTVSEYTKVLITVNIHVHVPGTSSSTCTIVQ